MIIKLFKSSNTPIYLQIVEEIKKQIMNNSLKPNDALPSIRSLASDLKVSVITTKRAYLELEKEGFIETIAGKGSYITNKTVNVIEDEYYKNLEESIKNIYSCADALGLSKEELIEIIEQWRD